MRPRGLLLASASPRRAQLVSLMGLPVRIVPMDVPEERYQLADPVLTALSIARAKGDAALPMAQPHEIVLAADTIVVSEGRVLGKPRTAEAARAVLASLSGRTHTVVSGVSLRAHDARDWGTLVTCQVRMRPYSIGEVERYVARGEPFDKAGGYAIQDAEFHPAAASDGCFLSVVGLPLCAVARGLETLGLPVPSPSPRGFLIPPCFYCARGAAMMGANSVPPSWYTPR